MKTLSGHPRTCWSVVFHPNNPNLIASGDLSGEVRVWGRDGGKEIWRRGGTEGLVKNFHSKTSNDFHTILRSMKLKILSFFLFFWKVFRIQKQNGPYNIYLTHFDTSKPLSFNIEFLNHEKKQGCPNQIEYHFVFIRRIISCSSPSQTSSIFGNGKKLLRMLLGAHFPHNRLPS